MTHEDRDVTGNEEPNVYSKIVYQDVELHNNEV